MRIRVLGQVTLMTGSVLLFVGAEAYSIVDSICVIHIDGQHKEKSQRWLLKWVLDWTSYLPK